MATAENGILYYEAGQVSAGVTLLTDSGDHTIFTSSAPYWSRRSGYAPTVLVNGLINGGAVTPAAAAGNDDVDVAAALVNLNGVETSVSADTDVQITRPATAVAKVNSITINSSGTVAVVAGDDGATTTFSETRGAAGGPPLIPVDSIEIAQVRVTSNTSAVITAAQIYSLPGTHTEYANQPGYTVDYRYGKVTMESALPLIHTGTLAKRVYVNYATASFSSLSRVKDFVPPATTASANSEQYYGGNVASISTSINQGSFTAFLEDGITDSLLTYKNEYLWFKFYSDRDKNPFHAVQGYLTVNRTYPVDNQIQAACSVTAETVGTDHAS